MPSITRALTLSGILGALAAAAFVVPAFAEVKGECVIDAEAKMQDKHERDEGPQLLGGEGRFTFDTLAFACIGDSNKDGVPEVVTGLNMAATGWYDNTICGTGKAFGTVTRITGGPPRFQAMVGEEFSVQFVAFEGVFKWRDWDKPDAPMPKFEPESDDPTKTAYDGTPAGAVVLELPNHKPTPTLVEALENLEEGECTKAFRVSGVVAVHFGE